MARIGCGLDFPWLLIVVTMQAYIHLHFINSDNSVHPSVDEYEAPGFHSGTTL